MITPPNHNGKPINNKLTDQEIETQQTEKRLRFGDVFLLIIGHSVITIFFISCITTSIVQTESHQVLQLHDVSTQSKILPKEQSESDNQKVIRTGNLENSEQPLAKITVVKLPSASAETTEKASKHPLVQLLSKDKRILTVLIVFICAVISAPLTEEFLYRGVLTGWIANSAKAYFGQLGLNNKATKIFTVILAICFPALFFATLHAGNNPEHSAKILLATILAVTLSNFTTLAGGIYYLTKIRKFTFEQIGFQNGKLRVDILTSVLVSVLVIPPLLLLTGVLREKFPTLVVDPFPLFFFAVVLGAIFLITHRLLPCILVHAMLNYISFMALFWR
ncbi:MAG: CPBP family intramembrane metalloprotease [Planctomycetaceae bacterium]|jgi:membrane protease YdiL (CAAX protease family)|nr:CPBP family intramembrane metalloprotease [Planctomycetaceae bacterium]